MALYENYLSNFHPVSSYAWSWNRCKSWCRGTRRTRCHRGTAWRRPCSRNGRGWLPRRVREVDEQLLYMRSTSQWSQTVDQSTAGFVFRSLDDLEYSSSTCCRVHGPRFQSVSTARTFISPPSRPSLLSHPLSLPRPQPVGKSYFVAIFGDRFVSSNI